MNIFKPNYGKKNVNVINNNKKKIKKLTVEYV